MRCAIEWGNYIRMKRVRGADLTLGELGIINQNRVLEFGAKRMLDPKTNANDAEDFFYLIGEGGTLVAFMRLGKEKYRYLEKYFEMWTFSTLVAIEKKKGYGRELLNELKKFSDDSGMSIVGFCSADLKEYYLKNDWRVLSAEDNQYYYIDGAGKEVPKEYAPGEVVYLNGADDFFRKLKLNNDKRVGLIVSWTLTT